MQGSQGKDFARKKDLAIIHAAKKRMGLDDESYRDLLEGVTSKGGTKQGKRSAADLTASERQAVIAEMERQGGQTAPRLKGKRIQPADERAPLLSKVYALLYHLDLSIEYALGILKQMFKDKAPARLEWANSSQLHKLVAALEYHKKRSAAK
jgi:phage gp16-like protein